MTELPPGKVRPEPIQTAGTPRVTVGMPVFNAAKWLRQAIDSMLGQTFGDLELVISDNASTDGSLEIAQSYAWKDGRVRVVQNPVNLGVDNNYSLLVGYARGEYFKWASSNDLCDRTLLAKCMSVLDAQPDVALCYAKTKLFVHAPEDGRAYEMGVQTLDEDPLVRFRDVLERVGLNNAINGLIRMSVLSRTGLIRPHYSSDITLLAEIALRGKIVELPEFLFFRRFDRDSATSLQDALAVQQCHFPTAGFGMYFQTWRRCWGQVAAIGRADLPLPQRLRGLRYVAGTWSAALPKLYAEVKEAVASTIRRPPVSVR